MIACCVTRVGRQSSPCRISLLGFLCSPSLTVELNTVSSWFSFRIDNAAAYDISQLRIGFVELLFQVLCLFAHRLELDPYRLF